MMDTPKAILYGWLAFLVLFYIGLILVVVLEGRGGRRKGGRMDPPR